MYLTFIVISTCVLKFVKYWNKLKKISKLTDFELETSYDKMLTKLSFINEELIPQNDWEKAEALVEDIDVDDSDFVSLTRYLKASLWTGDKPLYDGLKAKRFSDCLQYARYDQASGSTDKAINTTFFNILTTFSLVIRPSYSISSNA